MDAVGALGADLIREFVIAAHFNLEKVQTMLKAQPALLHARHQWGEGDYEDALGAASHVGNHAIAEYVLTQGARLTIFAAAMLGRSDDVRAFLEADASLANGRGAHQIPVMFHAALSGSTAITELLQSYGCREGYSGALHAAISSGHLEMLNWLLTHGADDVQVLNYEGKTPLQKAMELGQADMAAVLKAQGAVI